MNKVFLGLILAVCVLGMALVMLNDRLGRKYEPRSVTATAEAPPASPAEMEANARARQIAEAARSLAEGPQKPVAESGATAPEPIIEIHEPAPEQPGQPGLMPPLGAESGVEAQQEQPRIMPQAAISAQPESMPAPEAQPAPEVRPVPEAKPAPEARPAPEMKPAQAAADGHAITRFVIYARDKGATVRLAGNGKLDYSSMNLSNPDRVVVDLPGVWKFPRHPGVPRNELVSAVRVGQSGDKTRVVIDLKQPARKILLVPHKSGDGVDVRIDK